MSSRAGFPSLRCIATSKSTGKPCKLWASPGTTVCPSHGGSTPATIAKAEARVSLAQLLGNDPRPPWQVLLDALQTADALLQDSRAKVRANPGELTPDLLDRLLDSTERAAKLSKMTLDANIGERQTRMLELEGQLLAEGVAAGLDALFARLVEEDGLAPAREIELRQVALEAAAAKLDSTTDRQPQDRPSNLRNSTLSRDMTSIRKLRKLAATQAEERGDGSTDDPPDVPQELGPSPDLPPPAGGG